MTNTSHTIFHHLKVKFYLVLTLSLNQPSCQFKLKSVVKVPRYIVYKISQATVTNSRKNFYHQANTLIEVIFPQDLRGKV